ncbi:MAG: hypothetical protein HYX69_06785 [Planctomycetia bacterium]|nr:hypothetical protein [Planctomycetia bacterium]
MVTDLDEPIPIDSEPSPRRRGRWFGLVLLLILIAGVAFVAPIVRTGIRMAKGVAEAVSQIVSGIAVAASAAVAEVFAAVDASDAVKEKLGEPLVFPAMEDVTYKSAPTTTQDELNVEFVVSGPNGDALVEATLRTAEQGLGIKKLTVTPADGGDKINVIEPP